jgi:lactoylglutathione lyase
MIEGLRLLRTAFVAADLDCAVRFYEQLGFEERARTQVGSAAVIAVLGLPGEPSRLQLTQPLETEPRNGGAYLVLEVADLDRALAGLADGGIVPDSIPPADIVHGSRTAVLRDPDGHGVELMQRTGSSR